MIETFRRPFSESALRLTQLFRSPWVLTAIITATTLLWTHDLGRMSFWDDEIFSLAHARSIQSLSSFLSVQAGNAHPPLFFLLLKGWLTLNTTTEAWARLLPVLLGLPSVYLVYLIGKRLFDRNTGILAGFLFSGMPLLLIYVREVRMYSLLITLSCLSLWSLLKALDRNDFRSWAFFSGITFLTMTTHYHGFLVLAGEGLFTIMQIHGEKKGFKALTGFILASLGAVVLFIPFIPALLDSLGMRGVMWQSGAKSYFVATGYLTFTLAIGQTLMPWRMAALAGGLMIFLVTVVSFFSRRMPAGIKRLILSYAVVTFLLGPLISHNMPRYYLFFTPVLSIFLAGGILSFPARRAALLFVVILGICWTSGSINYFNQRDFHVMAHIDPWREVAQFLQGAMGNGDRVMVSSSEALSSYYLPLFGIQDSLIKNSSLACSERGSGVLWLVLANPMMAEAGSGLLSSLTQNGPYAIRERFYFLEDANREFKQKFFTKNFAKYRVTVLKLTRG